jgi:deoxyhypusine synthase
MAFSSRDLARASKIFDTMVNEDTCTNILCLAGSLVSAGLKNVIIDLIKCNMVDAVVSTGAVVVDQDFFEGLGFNHYRGFIQADDNQLRELMSNRYLH